MCFVLPKLRLRMAKKKETPKEEHLEVTVTQLCRDDVILPRCPVLVWHSDSMMVSSLAESPRCRGLSAQPLTLNQKTTQTQNRKEKKKKKRNKSSFQLCGVFLQ